MLWVSRRSARTRRRHSSVALGSCRRAAE
jgi:hypothetical protein